MAYNTFGMFTENVKFAQLFQQTNKEALKKNEENNINWMKSKEDHTKVLSLLKTLPNQLTQEVMVPIGSKALMRGKIVHTNEILVCLGAGWFVKQSAALASEICDRRVTLCNDMLGNLEKERQLLSSRNQLPFDQEMFGNEIREPYVEEVETKWRKHHRQRELDYRQQLKKQKTEEKIPKIDEELWKKLELLELQEELQGELDKVHATESREQNLQYQQEPLPNSETNNFPETLRKELEHQGSEDVSQLLKRRVSFVEERSTAISCDTDEDSDSSGETIQFSHSSLLGPGPRQSNASDGQVLSPADIYNLVPKSIPKSILKRKSLDLSSTCQENLSLKEDKFQWMSSSTEMNDVGIPVAFGNVIEHVSEDKTCGLSEIPSSQSRPVSRFRAARKLTANSMVANK